MQMSMNGPCSFALAPPLCQIFKKEFVGRFWVKLWISIVSHGFFVWPWQNRNILNNHTNPLHHYFTCCTSYWVNYVGAKGRGVMLQYNKLYIFGNCGIRDAKRDLWVWNRNLVIWGHQDMVAPFHILHGNHKACTQLWVLGMFHHPNPKCT